jgi:hypothetical protein
MLISISNPVDRATMPPESRAGKLCLPLLLTASFCLATDLSQWFQNWQGNRSQSGNLMAVAMGDARRMFANHFFVKADAYFHSGFYPTVYDDLQSFQTPHIAEDSGAMRGNNTGDENTFLGRPRNWIDRFGREFFPSVHTHLTEGGANGEEKEGEVREILPWIVIGTGSKAGRNLHGHRLLAAANRQTGRSREVSTRRIEGKPGPP